MFAILFFVNLKLSSFRNLAFVRMVETQNFTSQQNPPQVFLQCQEWSASAILSSQQPKTLFSRNLAFARMAETVF